MRAGQSSQNDVRRTGGVVVTRGEVAGSVLTL